MNELIPIFAMMIPIILFLVLGTVAVTGMYFNYKKRKEIFALYHQERMAAVEKGIELPPVPDSFFGDTSPRRSPRHHLLKGMIWFFIGIVAFFALSGEDQTASRFALVPAAIGLAYLLYYIFVGRKEVADWEAAQKVKITQ